MKGGNVPPFLRTFVPGRGRPLGAVKATYFVAPDYLAVGSDDDYFLTPLTPETAQKVADLLGLHPADAQDGGRHLRGRDGQAGALADPAEPGDDDGPGLPPAQRDGPRPADGRAASAGSSPATRRTS